MDFFDDLGKKIGKTVKVIGDKSQEVVEIGKVNIEIGKEKTNIKKLYAQIGEAAYRVYCGEESEDVVNKLYAKMDERQRKIKELEELVKKLKES